MAGKLTAPQRRMLKRIKADPIGVYGPSDDRRITPGLESRGLITREIGTYSHAISYHITEAGRAALTEEGWKP